MVKELVSAEWLTNRLHEREIVIVDCRFDLKNPEEGRQQFQKCHIPGAVYFDLDMDLSGEVKHHGGRHPLPDINEFIQKLGKSGIDKSKHVVAYDDQNGAFAARMWWMLCYLGHEHVSVLNVSFSKWKEKGYPVSSEPSHPDHVTFQPNLQSEMALNIEDVKKEMGKEDILLVDSRAPERYRGETEPIDKKAGHIPGAVNFFWKGNVDDYGKWKSENELNDRFKEVRNKDLIVYCGSGVTASANILALKTIGKSAKLYIGSWSDWSSYEDNPVETNE